MKSNIVEILNEQINAEMFSSYLYLSMSSYFEDINFKGFASWMKVQAQEEMGHAMIIYNYIIERGDKVVLAPIAGPQTTWDSPEKAFSDALNHEKMITEKINKIVDMAITESDHATNNALQWFVTEQVEEESSVSDVLQKIKIVKADLSALFFIDQELSKRVYNTPSPLVKNN